MLNRLITYRSVRSIAKSSIAETCSSWSWSSSSISSRQFLSTSTKSPTLSHRSHSSTALLFLPQTQRQFSSSHDDFSPQKKHNLVGNDSEKAIFELIESHVKSNRIMLYMKGSPAQPMCGFSATVVQILKSQAVDFSSVNVLDYPELREGVKKYAQWPTIPQLYVNGEFIGGCDIIRDMNDSGELKAILTPSEGNEHQK